MIWQAVNSLIVAGFGVACLLSVRSACLAALTMLREYLTSDVRGEISHLRSVIASKDKQLFAAVHPTTHAVMAAQKAPARAYEPGWETQSARPRNPMRWDVQQPGDNHAVVDD